MGWLTVAFDLKQRLATLPTAQHARVISAAARKADLEFITLRRQLVAVELVTEWVAREGLKVEDVRAGLIALETLRRLEQVAPSKAAAIRRAVLLGELTQRSVIATLKEAARPAQHRPLRELLGAVQGLCEADGLLIDGLALRGSEALSRIGRSLDVDAEITSGKAMVGVFVSPSISAEGRPKATFGTNLFKYLAALAFYRKVLLGCSRLEWEEVQDILTLALKGVRDRIQVYDLGCEPD